MLRLDVGTIVPISLLGRIEMPLDNVVGRIVGLEIGNVRIDAVRLGKLNVGTDNVEVETVKSVVVPRLVPDELITTVGDNDVDRSVLILVLGRLRLGRVVLERITLDTAVLRLVLATMFELLIDGRVVVGRLLESREVACVLELGKTIVVLVDSREFDGVTTDVKLSREVAPVERLVMERLPDGKLGDTEVDTLGNTPVE